MSERLLEKLAPRLRRLDGGTYEREYRRGGHSARTSTHQLVAELLKGLGVRFKEDVRVPIGAPLVADFAVNGIFVFVDPAFSEDELASLAAVKKRSLVIKKDSSRSDRFDHGIRVIGLGEESGLQTIFLDDPSFSFDYAHILPKTEKCSVMHGHTSSVLVEVIGRPIDGMVVDFGAAKLIVREAVKSLDHKLLIDEKYVTAVDSKNVSLKFDTVHGGFAIRAPKETTVLIRGEATVENMAREVLARITPGMPRNVTAVGVYVYEGLNKGSHILATLHQDGVRAERRKR